jgi:hypothetical protein
MKDQSRFIDEKYLPPSFLMVDPSKLIRNDAEKLIRFWVERNKTGKKVVFKFKETKVMPKPKIAYRSRRVEDEVIDKGKGKAVERAHESNDSEAPSLNDLRNHSFVNSDDEMDADPEADEDESDEDADAANTDADAEEDAGADDDADADENADADSNIQQFFYEKKRYHILFPGLFGQDIPIPVITLTATLAKNCIDEWSTGSRSLRVASSKTYKPHYAKIDEVARKVDLHVFYGPRFRNKQRALATEW